MDENLTDVELIQEHCVELFSCTFYDNIKILNLIFDKNDVIEK